VDIPADRTLVDKPRWLLAAAAVLIALGACEPTVRVEAPKEPITINLNIKLDADVRVKLEEQAEQDIDKNKDIF
jgi:hypothetical protein